MKWNSVSISPSEPGSYLVVINYVSGRRSPRIDITGWFPRPGLNNWMPGQGLFVTHWMPLPVLPDKKS